MNTHARSERETETLRTDGQADRVAFFACEFVLWRFWYNPAPS